MRADATRWPTGRRTRGGVAIATALVAFGCSSLEPETGALTPACLDVDSDPALTVDFARDLRPLLDGKVEGTKGCAFCHFPGTLGQEGFLATGLDLSTLQTLRRGGRGTPPEVIVVPGKPCSSAIVKKLQGTFGDARMPKNGPYWEPAKLQLMIDWIAEGARGGDE